MKTFLYSILVTAIGVMSLQFISIPQVSAQGWTKGLSSVSSAKTGLPDTEAKQVILNVVKWLLSLVFMSAVLAFVGAGLIFIFSFGKSGIHGMAKDWLTYAIIGLVVSILGYVIVLAISKMLIGEETSSPTVQSTGMYIYPYR